MHIGHVLVHLPTFLCLRASVSQSPSNQHLKFPIPYNFESVLGLPESLKHEIFKQDQQYAPSELKPVCVAMEIYGMDLLGHSQRLCVFAISSPHISQACHFVCVSFLLLFSNSLILSAKESIVVRSLPFAVFCTNAGEKNVGFLLQVCDA